MKQSSIPESVRLAVHKFRKAHLSWIFLLCLLSVVTVWNFATGFVILLLRQLRFDSIDFIGFSLVGIPICLLVSATIASRRQISKQKALAVIDGHNKAGGLMLATSETGDISWVDRLSRQPEVPGLKARFGERIPALLFSILFLIAGIKIPLYDFSRDRDPGMDLKGLEEKVLMQIDTLEETDILTQEEAEELKETVEQIVKTADKNDPSKTFEAFDQLEEKIQKEGATSAQKTIKQLEELEKMKNLAEKLQSTDSSDSESLKSALSDLQNSFSSSEASRKMAVEKKNSIQKGLDSVSQDGNPSPEQVKKAAEELKSFIQQEAKRLSQAAQKLNQAKIIDRKTFDRLMREGKIRPIKNQQDMENNQGQLIMAPANDGGVGQSSGEAGEQNGPSGQSPLGKGATSRGPGTAPINYERKSSMHKVKFNDEKLPDPGSTSLEDSVAIGVGITSPELEAENASGNLLNQIESQDPGRSGGKSELILPRHRSTVKSYFNRKSP